MKKIRAALVGNPNSGKTTLFNNLTGSRHYVGNRPGVTVEKKEGIVKAAGKHGYVFTLVDLPGIYSLSPYSPEEVVTREYILFEKPDVVINIVDATNIERNLYLSMQLLEMEVPMVIALNMMDESRKRGDVIDIPRLSELLNVKCIPISAKTGEGIDDLLKAVFDVARFKKICIPKGVYDYVVNDVIFRVERLVWKNAIARGVSSKWAAIKLLEGDELVREGIGLSEDTIRQIDRIAKGRDMESSIVSSRYGFIEKVVSETVVRKDKVHLASRKIDSVVTNKYLAIPIFLLVMFCVFILTFGQVGVFLQDCVNDFVEYLGNVTEKGLVKLGTQEMIIDLIINGVLAGVGGVLSFLPQIAILFFLISIIEDTGYMARIAFVMDRLLGKIGLSGKAFIPMLMGFGCTVPACLAARTIEDRKGRQMTILLIPFMSCSAKMPIYGFLAQRFFNENRVLVVFSLYVLGIILMIMSGVIFKNTLFKGSDTPFVIEMPPYRMPILKNALRHVWERVEHFLKKAATLIFFMSLVVWFLQSFNLKLQYVESSESIISTAGKALSVIFKPLGFGTWRASVALISGLEAKEELVSTLNMMHGGVDVFNTPLEAYSFLVFTLLYVPCMATFSTMKKELGSRKFAIFSAIWQILVAYAVSFLVYSVGKLVLT
ncbi:MAG: ferrous iron transport protein B [Clostridiaceae bacterium]|nr:ferrous iron transport protein B [Clostridiaceae bacterium]